MFITQSSPLANLGEWFSRDNPTDSPRHPICCCLSHITTQSERHFLAQSGFNKFVQFPPFLAPISVNSFVTPSPVFGQVWPDSTNNALAAVIISPSVAHQMVVRIWTRQFPPLLAESIFHHLTPLHIALLLISFWHFCRHKELIDSAYCKVIRGSNWKWSSGGVLPPAAASQT